MLIRSDRVHLALISELKRLSMNASSGEGSASAATQTAARMLVSRDRIEPAETRHRLAVRLKAAVLPVANDPALDALLSSISESLNRDAPLAETFGVIEEVIRTLTSNVSLDPKTRERVVSDLARVEIDSLIDELGPEVTDDGDELAGTELSSAGLTEYLRTRFNEPDLQLLSFAPLPGGFGKQTFLFDVQGKALNGQFVLRRDLPISLIGNDCHNVLPEFRLIEAVAARGFPAPQLEWLETEHPGLPGGDFFVMRRSPGVAGGSVFEATGPAAQDLSRTLATILARLHSLPPMPELGDLTNSINAASWNMPLAECVERYIDSYYDLYRVGPKLPSPALTRLFEWLRRNMPKLEGRAALLHGDIGFHNFVLDGGQLTAVLDWEHAHLGDPAEDIAYVRNTIGDAIDWTLFLKQYRDAGGVGITAERLHFFQIWGQTRNICASNLAAARFADGSVRDLKLLMLPYIYVPQFFRAAQDLIDAGVPK